jgi:hypothetical protein
MQGDHPAHNLYVKKHVKRAASSHGCHEKVMALEGYLVGDTVAFSLHKFEIRSIFQASSQIAAERWQAI